MHMLTNIFISTNNTLNCADAHFDFSNYYSKIKFG